MALFKWIRRRLWNRYTLRTLLELDDRTLRDIGIERHELRYAASLPFWKDEAPDLQTMAEERRKAEGRDFRLAPLRPAMRCE